MELATLCGVKACVVCVGPQGEIETWPENPNQVKAIVEIYKEHGVRKYKKKVVRREKVDGDDDHQGNLQVSVGVLDHGNHGVKREKMGEILSQWNEDWINGLSKDALNDVLGMVDAKLKDVNARINDQLVKLMVNAEGRDNGGGTNGIHTQTMNNEELLGNVEMNTTGPNYDLGMDDALMVNDLTSALGLHNGAPNDDAVCIDNMNDQELLDIVGMTSDPPYNTSTDNVVMSQPPPPPPPPPLVYGRVAWDEQGQYSENMDYELVMNNVGMISGLNYYGFGTSNVELINEDTLWKERGTCCML